MEPVTLLLEFLPAAIGVAVAFFIIVLKYWKPTKRFTNDLRRTLADFRIYIYLRYKLNPNIKHSFEECQDEPLMKVYKDLTPAEIVVDSSVDRTKITLEPGIGVARIKVFSFDDVVDAIYMHIEQNLSRTSAVKDFKKLQKAIDLFTVTLVIDKMRLDGALSVALHKSLDKHMKDEQVKVRYECLEFMNQEMITLQPPISREFLTILLTELEGWNLIGAV